MKMRRKGFVMSPKLQEIKEIPDFDDSEIDEEGEVAKPGDPCDVLRVSLPKSGQIEIPASECEQMAIYIPRINLEQNIHLPPELFEEGFLSMVVTRKEEEELCPEPTAAVPNKPFTRVLVRHSASEKFHGPSKPEKQEEVKKLEREASFPPAKQHKFYDGFLAKKQSKLLGSWSLRYCKFEEPMFVVYRNVETGMISLAFDFSRVPVRMLHDARLKQFTLAITTELCNKSYAFQAQSEEEFKSWVRILHAQIEIHRAKKFRLLVPKIDSYWKYLSISYSDMVKRVESGDILLFRGQTFSAKTQRLMTGSRYDHVALLLKCVNDRVIFVDATSNEGVALCLMESFVAYECYKGLERLVYRPVNYPRNKENQKKLEQYVRQVVGKKFDFSPFRLMKKYSTEDSVYNVSKKEGFFCSELVASFFKLLGLLPKHITSSHY